MNFQELQVKCSLRAARIRVREWRSNSTLFKLGTRLG